MMLSAKTVSSVTAKRATPGARPVHASPILKRAMVVRSAEKEPSSSSASTTSASGTTDESVAKLQASATEALEALKTKWDATENSEKPAAIAIIVGVIVAQIAVGATIDAVDKIPIINKGLQLIGVAVTTLFFYRYFTDPAERDSVKKSVDAFVKSVTGDK